MTAERPSSRHLLEDDVTFTFRILVAVSSLLTVQPSPTPDPARDLRRIEKLVFSTPISDFVKLTAVHSVEDSWFDWTTDGCSAPVIGDSGHSFDFARPCLRHDFAYRNYKLLDARYSCPNRTNGSVCTAESGQQGAYWNSGVRKRIDQQFRQDMLYECALRKSSERFRCRLWAETYYKAVRIAGGP